MISVNNKKKRILITGSHGFIGKHLTSRLKQSGHHIIEFDKSYGQDVCNIDDLLSIKRVDFVIHLAGISYIPYSWTNPGNVFSANIDGMINIMEFCRKKDCGHVIYPNTYVYGTPKYLPVDENHPIDCKNPYCRSKFLAEEIQRGYCEDFGVSGTSFRLFNIYGPKQNTQFLIPKILHQLRSGVITLDNPTPKRDYLYITDLVDLFIKSISSKHTGFQCFNVGFGKSHSVEELVKLVISLSGKRVKIKYENKIRKNEINNVIADITKVMKEFEWKPSISLETGLSNLINTL